MIDLAAYAGLFLTALAAAATRFPPSMSGSQNRVPLAVNVTPPENEQFAGIDVIKRRTVA